MGKRKKLQMQKKFKRNPAFKDMQIIESPDGEKMSDVISRFVEPYKTVATTKDAYEKLIVLALVAWNASIMKGAAGQQIINSIRETIGEAWSLEVDQLLIALMVRKERFFADNKRIILDYRVTETRDELKLSVISTPDAN